MNKNKVLFVLHMPPPVHGAAMVGKYIHDSELVNNKYICEYINLTTAKDLQDIGKGSFRKLWKFIKLLYHVITGILRFKPALVYITPNSCGGAFYKDFIVVQFVKCLGCKVVVHYHNKGVATRQDRTIDNMLYRRFFKGVKVILLAEALYKDVEKYVKREDVYICPNGIPESLVSEPVAERHNRIPHLLFLSNLIESKGVIVLLDALKILKDNGCSFVCDFVGGETSEIDKTRFEEEVRNRCLNGSVVYHGKKYGKDKERFFLDADIFVFPTFYYNECFPLVLLEAIQYGLPCVSTNEGGIRDVVKNNENGLISERMNPLSLADCISTLLADKDLCEKMGEKGYRMFKEHFTLQAFERKFVEVIENAIGM
ncbi:glycosyltransferase family 4 protein [Xylanibacter muris]|uniref:Glycosyltransferase family 4 protein n=2 Tax=Xylanibacter muris TaxID=2736290 RepID=A0ABX2AQI4_9BACT|nr:glycosyltransferase family 4 protein [Xylanibacter muris]NPD92807.1 glycosyltransferase family 4 protein [Xylanibacter muris]